jgi:hypothetical protein
VADFIELEAKETTFNTASLKLIENACADQYEVRGRSRPSLQAAAWTSANLPLPQSCNNFQLDGHEQASQPKLLLLEQALAFNVEKAVSTADLPKALLPRLGSPELPSVGSLGHHINRCKPCAFVSRSGCSNAAQCSFCHLCAAGEKKRRRKEKRALIGAARRLVAA